MIAAKIGFFQDLSPFLFSFLKKIFIYDFHSISSSNVIIAVFLKKPQKGNSPYVSDDIRRRIIDINVAAANS